MAHGGNAAGTRWALLSFLATSLACGGQDHPPVFGDIVDNPPAEMDASLDGAFVLPPQVLPDDDPTTCDAAAASRSYVGCDYWPTPVANNVWSIFDYAVVVANAGAASAAVTITGPQGTNQTKTVAPNTLATFYLPWVPELKGVDADACGVSAPLSSSVISTGGAYHLVSSVPVTVYQFNALEYVGAGGPSGKSWASCPGLSVCTDPIPGQGMPVGCYSFSNDASLLLPSTAMTGNYRVAGIAGGTTVDPTSGQSLPTMGTYFAVTATADGTHVTVQLSPTSSVLSGNGVQAMAGGGTLTLALDAGDVAQIAGVPGDTFDFSGSLVAADQPVQVIAGSPCSEVPEGAPACDHLEQSVFPAETLGKQYFVTVPSGPYGTPYGHLVRLYGNADGTSLTYNPPMPACPATLDAGQVADCGVVRYDFEVTGTHEFAVGSFMLGGSIVDPQGGLGDPSATFMAAVEQYRTKYVFLAPSDYETNFADIVAPSGTTVVLDNATIATNGKNATTIADGYVVVHRVSLGARGAHVLAASAPIGLQVLGYGLFTSYQYPGGLNLKMIAPPPTLH